MPKPAATCALLIEMKACSRANIGAACKPFHCRAASCRYNRVISSNYSIAPMMERRLVRKTPTMPIVYMGPVVRRVGPLVGFLGRKRCLNPLSHLRKARASITSTPLPKTEAAGKGIFIVT